MKYATILNASLFCLFLLLVSCDESIKEITQETESDFIVNKYFKVNVSTAHKLSKDEIIVRALNEKKKLTTKEGGIIKFFEEGNSIVYAYVEYHFPANPAKENSIDEEGNKIEVKLFD